MALQHLRAINDHAVTTDPLGRAILKEVALDIGHNNQPSFPSYRTIAKRVGCHYNSVAAWVKKLAECGDLIVTKEGRQQKYNIPFDVPLSQPDYDNSYDNACDNSYDDTVTNLVTTVTILSQAVDDIVTRLSQIEQLLSQPDYDRSIEVRSKEKNRSKNNIYIEPDRPLVVTIKTALSKTTKTPQEFEPEQYSVATETLIGYEATPEQIEGFRAWWDINGNYGGQPALRSLLSNWTNYTEGVTLNKQQPNGTSNGRSQPTPEERVAAIVARRES